MCSGSFDPEPWHHSYQPWRLSAHDRKQLTSQDWKQRLQTAIGMKSTGSPDQVAHGGAAEGLRKVELQALVHHLARQDKPIGQLQDLLNTLLAAVQLAAELANLAIRQAHLIILPAKLQALVCCRITPCTELLRRDALKRLGPLTQHLQHHHRTCCLPVAAWAAARTSSSVSSSIVM